MARISWKRSEINTIKENCDTKTTDELMELLPGRSRKSINRKIEKLRKEGEIGHRKKETIQRAYRQRKRGSTSKKRSLIDQTVWEEYEVLEDDE